jgi:two-component system, OmpR family, phosphate regulon sensor histidine kinase PhoR
MLVKLSFRLGIVTGLVMFFALLISYFSISKKFTEIVSTATKTELYRDLLLNRQILQQQPEGWKNSAHTNAWIKQIGRTLALRVTLIDLDGRVLSDSSVPQERLSSVENHRQRSEVKDALEMGYGENIRFSDTVQEYSLYMAIPAGLPQPCAILRFSKPIYDIQLFEGTVQKEIAQALLLALMFSITAGFLASNLLVRPLSKLAATIKEKNDGDFFVAPSLLHRHDEVGTLAQAITGMAGKITTMQRSEEWYQAVFSGIREAIIVTDASGNIILVNPAASRMFRIDGAMFKSRPIRHLSDNKLQELFVKVHSTKITLRKEEMSLMTTKGERIVQISSMPLIKENRFEGSVFVLNDITKLRNLEKIRRDFVSSVSHELRTPLTVISGYTETLLEGAMDDPKHAKRFLNIILHASEQLTALVNDVLDLSKIESGYIEYHFASLDLKSLLMKSVDLLKPSLEKKQIKLDIAMEDGLPSVYADARYLDIVIRNLLDNAIKYVDDRNGRIRITAFRSGDDVRLEVEDNGIGIAKQELDRIFERFYRVDKARSRQNGGTGLGLSIVKHIVLAHKGDVEVRSRLNHGSVFSVVLRRARESG